MIGAISRGVGEYPKWSEYCASRAVPPGIPVTTWAGWLCGKCRPPLTQITHLAAVLRCTEGEVIEAAYGFWSESADSAIEAREMSDRLRAKYATRKWRRERDGGASEALFDIKFEKRPRGKRRSRAKWPWIFRQLRYMRSHLDSIERRLNKTPKSIQTSGPWREDGCGSLNEWRKQRPEKARNYLLSRWKAATYRRRSVIGQAGGSWTFAEWIARMQEFGYCCAYCGMHRRDQRHKYGSDMEADHVVALSVGGSNEMMNVVPACKGCNSSKSNDDLIEWAKRRGLSPHAIALDAHAAHHHQQTAAG